MARGDVVVQVLAVMPTGYASGVVEYHPALMDWRTGGSSPAELVQVYDFAADQFTYLDLLCRLVGYNGQGLQVSLPWSASTATTGNVRWGVGIRRLQDDGEDIDGAHSYDYNEVVTACASVSGEVRYPHISFVHGPDMDSWAEGELAIVRVKRHDYLGVSQDTMLGDAELWGIVGIEAVYARHPATSDSASLAETTNLVILSSGVIGISRTEAVAVGETLGLNVPLAGDIAISRTEAAAAADSADLVIPSVGTLSVSVSEDVTLAETVTTPVTGQAYYVSTSGNDGWPGTFSQPWRHIDYAVGGTSALAAGDTLYIRGGTYDEVVDIEVSGTAGNVITIRNYPGETVTLRDTADTRSWKWQLFDQSYLKLYGLTWSGSGGSGFSGGGLYIRAYTAAMTDITLENCRFEYQTYLANGDAKHTVYIVATSGYAISYFYALDNTFYACDTVWQDGSHASDNMTVIGLVSYVVYDGNELEDCTGLGLNVVGTGSGQPHHIIIKNNTFDNCGTRRTTSAAQIYNDAAGSYIIIEDNVTGEGAIGIALASERGGIPHGQYVIVRRNVSYNNWMNFVLGGGWNDPCSTTSSPYDIRFSHNTGYLDYSRTNGKVVKLYCTERLKVMNNIFMEAGSVGLYMYSDSAASATGTWSSDYNIHYASGGGSTWWTWDGTYTSLAGFQAGTGEDTNSLASNPLFVNAAGGNFHLQSGSPARNAGGPLTTTTGAGTGTTVAVVDSRFFTDGFGLQDGDQIRIGDESVQVVAVNYSTHIITINRSITWDAGDEVNYEYQGSGPDMGAYEEG